MSDWTSGYVSEIGYTYGYYNELNPLRVKLAFLNAGVAYPEMGTACELGFGQGVAANIHAAATVTQWYGTDFNPSHAGFAQELSNAAGAQGHFYDESFLEFCARPDLPDFDFIALHGIWSWVSDENRALIVDFIRRKLKVGGVVYMGYNALPGWAPFAPVRHLMMLHADIEGSQGEGVPKKVEGALQFVENLFATKPIFALANPLSVDRFKQVQAHDRSYLAHEYFNRDWHPMYFSQVHALLGQAKLTYVCSAFYAENVAAINQTEAQQAMLKGIGDVALRESVRDFMVNQNFRRDYWVKGAVSINHYDRGMLLGQVEVILTTLPSDIVMKVKGALGEAVLTDAVYTPILELLSDHKVHTLHSMELALKAKNINLAKIVEAVMILVSANDVALAQSDAAIARAAKSAARLNDHLLNRALGDTTVNFLCSPVTGGGVPVGRFAQLFLISRKRGSNKPAEWAAFAASVLAASGQKIIKDGVELATPADNLAELVLQAEGFAERMLPILKALKIA